MASSASHRAEQEGVQVNQWENALSDLDEVAGLLDIPEEYIVILKNPRRSLIVSLPVRMDDGTEFECKAGDVSMFTAGHDAWVVGNEPVVVVDFQGLRDYAKAR